MDEFIIFIAPAVILFEAAVIAGLFFYCRRIERRYEKLLKMIKNL